MLEWYEAYADYRDTMERIEQLVSRDGAGGARHDDGDLPRARDRLRAAVARGSRSSTRSHEHGLWTRDEAELRAAAATSASVDMSQDPTWPQLIDHAHSHFVEPALIQPTILYDYPVELSPFARTTDDDPSIVERFEYFAGGMELGNAFSEINDAEEQAARFAQQQGERAAGDAEPSRATPTTSRRSRTACRRPAASASASTGSRCSSPAASRSATSCSSRRCAVSIRSAAHGALAPFVATVLAGCGGSSSHTGRVALPVVVLQSPDAPAWVRADARLRLLRAHGRPEEPARPGPAASSPATRRSPTPTARGSSRGSARAGSSPRHRARSSPTSASAGRRLSRSTP